MTRITEAQADLHTYWSTLKDQWQETRRLWRDPVADRFEREHWQVWENVVPTAIKAMAEIDEILDQAEVHIR